MIEQCADGNHNLIVIYRESLPPDGYASNVVRWCCLCGSVVVDQDFDGRTNPGNLLDMRAPEITRYELGRIKHRKSMEARV